MPWNPKPNVGLSCQLFLKVNDVVLSESYDIYRIISYLKFFLTSTNQHGVHSPFIYNYVTKCLYVEPHYNIEKSLNILLKSIPYFEAKRVQIFSEDPTIQNRISRAFPSLIFNEAKADIIYIESPGPELRSKFNSDNPLFHKGTMIIIDNIHGNKEASDVWKKFIELKHFTATIDLFHCGVVFLRREQIKEHFKIRI